MPKSGDNEDRFSLVGGGLPSVRRQNYVDVALLVAVILLGSLAVAVTLGRIPVLVSQLAVLGLVIVAFSVVYMRIMTRPDHVRALQSDRMMRIANESLAYLAEGLTEESAVEVCRIVLAGGEADAVAITDSTTVLGFAGKGQEHHKAGGPIITRATLDALEENEIRILQNREEIGCPESTCPLRAAIVAPLVMRGKAVGTLKLYYTSDRMLNENQVAMAEGMGKLLSTQLELSELERQTDLAREMELKALQAQINPHFLFNTINTIAACIRTDPEEARRLLRRFAAFYRRTLEHQDELVTIEKELEYVETYLELEKARFGDRLEYVRDVSREALALPMPAFMVQPLVENAVGHGMRPDGSKLTVTVSARVEGDCLKVAVHDDGAGISATRLPRLFEPGSSTGLGVALANVRERLSGYFGPESELRIESVEGVGTTVTMVVRPVPAVSR